MQYCAITYISCHYYSNHKMLNYKKKLSILLNHYQIKVSSSPRGQNTLTFCIHMPKVNANTDHHVETLIQWGVANILVNMSNIWVDRLIDQYFRSWVTLWGRWWIDRSTYWIMAGKAWHLAICDFMWWVTGWHVNILSHEYVGNILVNVSTIWG